MILSSWSCCTTIRRTAVQSRVGYAEAWAVLNPPCRWVPSNTWWGAPVYEHTMRLPLRRGRQGSGREDKSRWKLQSMVGFMKQLLKAQWVIFVFCAFWPSLAKGGHSHRRLVAGFSMTQGTPYFSQAEATRMVTRAVAFPPATRALSLGPRSGRPQISWAASPRSGWGNREPGGARRARDHELHGMPIQTTSILWLLIWFRSLLMTAGLVTSSRAARESSNDSACHPPMAKVCDMTHVPPNSSTITRCRWGGRTLWRKPWGGGPCVPCHSFRACGSRASSPSASATLLKRAWALRRGGAGERGCAASRAGTLRCSEPWLPERSAETSA